MSQTVDSKRFKVFLTAVSERADQICHYSCTLQEAIASTDVRYLSGPSIQVECLKSYCPIISSALESVRNLYAVIRDMFHSSFMVDANVIEREERLAYIINELETLSLLYEESLTSLDRFIADHPPINQDTYKLALKLQTYLELPLHTLDEIDKYTKVAAEEGEFYRKSMIDVLNLLDTSTVYGPLWTTGLSDDIDLI